MGRTKRASASKVTLADGSTAYRKRVWMGRDPLSGKRVQRTITARTVRELERAISEAKREATSRLSVERFLLDHWLPAKRQTGRCKPTTLHDYELAVRGHLVPAFGARRLDAVTTLDVQAWVGAQAARYAAGGVGLRFTVLRMAFAQAVRWRLLVHNPCAGVIVPRGEPARRQVWSVAALEAFLAGTADDPLHALWCLLGRTGLRLGEALALTWADLDLDGGVLHVGRTWTRDAAGRGIVGETTKSRYGVRDVALDGATVAVLRDHPRTGALVFAVRDRAARKALERACEGQGIVPVTPHHFRHCHQTHLVQAGVPLSVAMARLGHGTIAMSMRYSHPDLGDQARAIAAVFGADGARMMHPSPETGSAMREISS